MPEALIPEASKIAQIGRPKTQKEPVTLNLFQGLTLESGPLKSTIAASKWQRYRRKMAAADSHSACKGNLLREQSHFGVLRI
jgi:hypothetical protein